MSKSELIGRCPFCNMAVTNLENHIKAMSECREKAEPGVAYQVLPLNETIEWALQPQPSDVSSRQVGGDHYKNHKIQPWDIIDDWSLNYYEGNAIKYILREKHDRVEDLSKAIHSLEKLIELEKKDAES